MAESGGIADKLGGRFESRWTVQCALKILDGRADWIEIEPLGATGQGIEFVLSTGGARQHHQAKRTKSGGGSWSLVALRGEGVLGHFRRIVDLGEEALFVSGADAKELRDLSDASRKARSLDEFLAHLNRHLQERFGWLQEVWGWDSHQTIEGLKKIRVSTVDENILSEWNESLVEQFLDGQPKQALASLAEVLIDNMQQKLDANLIRGILREKYGLNARVWAHGNASEKVELATAEYLIARDAVRLRYPIDRPELEELLGNLRDAHSGGVLIAGSAGAGKSELIVQAVEALEKDGWIPLTIRADKLKEAASTEAIGTQLGLPGSPVPVLAAVADSRNSLLVIDQLDAVSLASGRNPRLWEPALAMIRQAQAHPNMRVLVACRQFDLDNDRRLGSLTDESSALSVLNLGRLTKAQIAGALDSMGIAGSELTEAQTELLQWPVHLKLLEPLAASKASLGFTNEVELLDAFWDERKQAVLERDGSVKFGSTLKLLSDTMSQRRTLVVPKAYLESMDLERSAQVLASEKLLMRDGNSYGFFHERFFDYTFAKFHLGSGKNVMDLVRAGQQDLFLRSQVRQVLTQERGDDFDTYLEDLEQLVGTDSVRFHIRQVILALLKDVPAPTIEELQILRPILEGDLGDPRRRLAWQTIRGPNWFSLLSDQLVLREWISSERRETVDSAISLLSDADDSELDYVAQLVGDVCDWGDEWQNRISFLLRFVDTAASRGIFELALELSNQGCFGAIDDELWALGYRLPESQPEWAGELLKSLLQRSLRRAASLDLESPLGLGSPLENDYAAQEFVQRLSESGPLDLVNAAVPWMLEIAESDVERNGSATSKDNCLSVDRVWGFRTYGHVHGFSDVLLSCVEKAIGAAAAASPEEVEPVISVLEGSSLDIGQLLLYRALAGNPKVFADRAARLILQTDTRLRCGYMSDDYWVTRELILATSPEMSEESFSAVEAKLMSWTPKFELRAESRFWRGTAQRCLLSAMDPERRSGPAKRRLGELGRKLGSEEPDPPASMVVGSVDSPVPDKAARHMSDKQWLKAIQKHQSEWRSKNTLELVGGSDELASVLRQLAEEEPERFAKLGLLIPEDTPEVYFERLIIGLSQSEAQGSTEAVFGLARRVSSFVPIPGRRFLSGMIARYSNEEIPDDMLELVAELAGDPDPTSDIWMEEAPSGGRWYGGQPRSHGMNTVRGSASQAIARLIDGRIERADFFDEALGRLSIDDTAAVRTCAAEAIGVILSFSRERSLELTKRLVATDLRALAEAPVARLLSAFVPTDWDFVEPLVRQMLESDHEVVRGEGARLGAFRVLEVPGDQLAEELISSEHQAIRETLARVYGANLNDSTYRATCVNGLLRLFDDDSSEVRTAATSCFRDMEGDDLKTFDSLSIRFLESRSLADGRSSFIDALESSSVEIWPYLKRLVSRMIDEVDGLGDIQTAAGVEAKDLSELLVRVIEEEASDAHTVDQALDALDQLIAGGGWQVLAPLETLDR